MQQHALIQTIMQASNVSLSACVLGAWCVQVTHAPIPNVTSAMMYWWFNGNVDGDMVHPTNGQVYPRYGHARLLQTQANTMAPPPCAAEPGSTCVQCTFSGLSNGFVLSR